MTVRPPDQPDTEMLLKDGAYAAWQRMVKSGTIPDDVTQRILAACFGSNLRMASEVVKEARQLQAGDCNSGLHSMHTDIHAHICFRKRHSLNA